MTYKEFGDKLQAWGEKYGYDVKVTLDECRVFASIIIDSKTSIIASVNTMYRYIIDAYWVGLTTIKENDRGEFFDILAELAKTPIEEREEQKKFIIPLPNLTTTDGEQQYLTNRDSYFFACGRNRHLRQTWKEEDLKYVPEEYRQYAVEYTENW